MCLTVICAWLVVNLFRNPTLKVSGHGRVRLIISRHRPSVSCTPLSSHIRQLTAAPVIRVAVRFSALLGLLLRFCGSRLNRVLLGAESLRVVLFLGFLLVDDHCEELLHLFGHAGG